MKFDTPATTNPIDQLKVVGKPTDRIDGPYKTTGTAPYAYDRYDVVPNQAYGYVVGSAIANIATVPFGGPRALNLVLQIIVARILARFQRTYAERRELDIEGVNYFQVFRCVHQLTAVLRNRAAGGQLAGTFDSAVGVANLVRHIRAISGVTIDGIN